MNTLRNDDSYAECSRTCYDRSIGNCRAFSRHVTQWVGPGRRTKGCLLKASGIETSICKIRSCSVQGENRWAHECERCNWLDPPGSSRRVHLNRIHRKRSGGKCVGCSSGRPLSAVSRTAVLAPRHSLRFTFFALLRDCRTLQASVRVCTYKTLRVGIRTKWVKERRMRGYSRCSQNYFPQIRDHSWVADHRRCKNWRQTKKIVGKTDNIQKTHEKDERQKQIVRIGLYRQWFSRRFEVLPVVSQAWGGARECSGVRTLMLHSISVSIENSGHMKRPSPKCSCLLIRSGKDTGRWISQGRFRWFQS